MRIATVLICAAALTKYRVIGPLSNLPEFAKAFSCKAGSPMVRSEGECCEVW